MPQHHPSRRSALLHLTALATVAATSGASWAAAPTAQPIPVELWKDPTCGCCHDWITHMQDNGCAVTAHDTGNTAVRPAWACRKSWARATPP